jgi:PAS domain-containing protein
VTDPAKNLYQTVFEHLHIGVKVWKLEDPEDPGSLRLIASNPAASGATGVRREQVLGKTISESFPDAVTDGIAAAWAEVATSGQAKDMGEIVYSDPRVREGVFSVFAFPLPDNIVGVAFENITRRKWEIAAVERKASFVHLLQKVAVCANEAESSDEALQQCLDDVCRHTGWPVGHVYRVEPEGDRLTPSTLWHVDDVEKFTTFRRITEQTTFAIGRGLPGRVLADGKPHWIIDVMRDDNFPRAQAAEDLGVQGAFGFPVMVKTEVVAVLEFFSPGSKVPDPLLLDVMEQVGIQLGRVIERERAQIP